MAHILRHALGIHLLAGFLIALGYAITLVQLIWFVDGCSAWHHERRSRSRHILGIGGTFMAGLARLAVERGWQVTGATRRSTRR